MRLASARRLRRLCSPRDARGASCFGADDSTPARAKGKGRVTIVYQDDTIQPENRDAIKKIMDSGVFERMADRLTKAVALPHDLQVVVTDNVPKGVDDPTTEVDGRRIFWPAAFSKTDPRRPHRIPPRGRRATRVRPRSSRRSVYLDAKRQGNSSGGNRAMGGTICPLPHTRVRFTGEFGSGGANPP